MSDVPFANGDDDFYLPAGVADGKGSQQVIDDTSYKPAPIGRNEYVVLEVALLTKDTDGRPDEKTFECFTANDSTGIFDVPAEYSAHEVEVTYGLATDTRLTVREKFRMPPSDDSQMDLYLYAASAGDKTKAPKDRKASNEFFYNQIRRFLHATGHKDDVDPATGQPTGLLPATGRSLGGWRVWPDGNPRSVSLDIAEREYVGRDGQTKKAANIKIFSHEMTEDTKARMGQGQTVRPPARSMASPPASRPASPPPGNRPASPPPSRPGTPPPAARPSGGAPRKF